MIAAGSIGMVKRGEPDMDRGQGDQRCRDHPAFEAAAAHPEAGQRQDQQREPQPDDQADKHAARGARVRSEGSRKSLGAHAPRARPRL